jgi:hypothetical protein
MEGGHAHSNDGLVTLRVANEGRIIDKATRNYPGDQGSKGTFHFYC